MNDWIPIQEAVAAVSKLCPACWVSKISMKYIDIRVDTRDLRAAIFAGHLNPRVRISIADIEATVASCKASGMHLKEKS